MSWLCKVKGYASTDSVNLFNFFHPELQLKDTEYATRNERIDLLSELKAFRDNISFRV